MVHDTSISKLDSLKIVLRATDPGGFPITYSLQDTLPNSGFVDSLFVYFADCDQVGAHQVTFIASDGHSAPSTQSCTITVNDRDVSLPVNPTIADVQIHPEDITLTSELLAPDTVAVTLHTGPIRLKLTDGSCLQSCVFFCCCGYDWSLDLDIDDIAVVYHVPAEAALCGT